MNKNLSIFEAVKTVAPKARLSWKAGKLRMAVPAMTQISSAIVGDAFARQFSRMAMRPILEPKSTWNFVLDSSTLAYVKGAKEHRFVFRLYFVCTCGDPIYNDGPTQCECDMGA